MRRLASIIVALALAASPLQAVGPYTGRQITVDTENPVNRSHPLFKSCTNWYMTLPNRMGGTRVMDLMRVLDGTLTTSGTSTKGWSPWSRPGGFGSLLFDSTSSSYYQMSSLSQFSYLQNTMVFTVSFWMANNALTTRQIIMETGTASASKGFFISFENGAGVGTKAIRIVLFKGVGGISTWGGRGPDNEITDTAWHHIVLVGNGTSVAIYIDGVSQAITVEAAFSSLSSGNSTFNLSVGSDPIDSALFVGGNLDDVIFFNSTLSASDVMNLYNLSKQGYPGVLNRQKPSFLNLFSSGAAPAATASLRTLLGVGL